MRIGINARYLQNPYSGIEVYLSNLILNLKKIDRKNEYTLFFGSRKNLPKNIPESEFNYDIPKIHADNQLLKLLWSQLYLPIASKKHKIEIFHEPSFVAPLFKRCPLIITVYDVAYLYVPHCFTYRNRLYFQTLLSRSIKQSNLIIATSENTKNDILTNFSGSRNKVKVIYGAVDRIFNPITDKEEIDRIKVKYKIKKDFVLAVSLISPRKNLVNLIKAFKILRCEKKLDIQLVIVGRKGWLYEEVFEEAVLSGLENDIIFCGHVPNSHLVYLYNSAAVFAYPSLYEGFGLPILEAMACGCAVVSSNTTSMPEVCGNAALLTDPKSPLEISKAIYKLLFDSSLKQNLIKNGLERAKNFSWQKTAEETLKSYIQIAGQ